MSCGELLIPLRRTKDVPALDGNPISSCEIGCREYPFTLEQVCIILFSGAKGDNGAAGSLKVRYRKHLSSDCLVSYPEDKILSPLHGFDHIGQFQEEFADLLNIHASEYKQSP